MHRLKKVTEQDRYGNKVIKEYEVDQKALDPTTLHAKKMEMGVPEMPGAPPVAGEEFNMGNPNNHPGKPIGEDTVPAWLTPGEFVVNKEATQAFGPQIEAMNNVGRAIKASDGGIMPGPGMSNPETDLEYKWLGGVVNAMRYILPAAGIAGAAHRASQMSQPDDHLQATQGAQEKAMDFFKPATEQPQPQQFNQGGDVQYANWGQAITGFLNRFGGGGNDVAVDEFSHTIPHDIAGVNSVGGQGENQARQWMNTFSNSYADPMGFDSGDHISTHAQMMQDPRLQAQEKSRFKAEVAGMAATPENISNATMAYADRFGVSEMQAKSELGFLNDIPSTQLGDDAAAQMELDNMRVAQELGGLPANEAPPLPEDVNWGGGRGDTSGDTAAQRTQYNSGDDIWVRAQDAIDAGASKEEQDALVEQYAARTGVSKLRARQELGFGHERGGKSHLEKAREVRQGMMGLQGGDVEGDARGRGLAIAQAGVPGLPEDVPTDAEVAAGEADAARRNVDARTMDSVVNPSTGTDEVQSFTGKGATAHQDRYSAAAVGTDDRPLIEGYNDYVASLPSSALPKSYEDWVSERQRFVERNSIRPGDASVVVDEFGGISRDLADGDAQITDAATAMDLTDVNVERNPYDTSWTPNEDVGGASGVPEPTAPPPETSGETGGDQGETGGDQGETGGDTQTDTGATIHDDGSVTDPDGNTIQPTAEQTGKVAQWFKDNVPIVGELIGGSGLLDDQALKQMATLYLGQRLLGYSHGGALNWAASNYLKTVQGKQKAKAEQQAELAKEQRAWNRTIALERFKQDYAAKIAEAKDGKAAVKDWQAWGNAMKDDLKNKLPQTIIGQNADGEPRYGTNPMLPDMINEAENYAIDNLKFNSPEDVRKYEGLVYEAFNLAGRDMKAGNTVNSIKPYMEMARMQTYAGTNSNRVWNAGTADEPELARQDMRATIMDQITGYADGQIDTQDPAQRYHNQKVVMKKLSDSFYHPDNKKAMEKFQNPPEGMSPFMYFVQTVLEDNELTQAEKDKYKHL